MYTAIGPTTLLWDHCPLVLDSVHRHLGSVPATGPVQSRELFHSHFISSKHIYHLYSPHLLTTASRDYFTHYSLAIPCLSSFYSFLLKPNLMQVASPGGLFQSCVPTVGPAKCRSCHALVRDYGVSFNGQGHETSDVLLRVIN